ncbi:unnamed protein product [Cercospora beticola]|nr:unnamed protein product [Cercospora beticola]
MIACLLSLASLIWAERPGHQYQPHQARDNLLARTTKKSQDSISPTPCPTILTASQRVDCGGCYQTEYSYTSTESIDCGGCETLTTSTQYNRFVGVCPVCIGGVQTRHDSTGTTTVTSCKATPLHYYSTTAS